MENNLEFKWKHLLSKMTSIDSKIKRKLEPLLLEQTNQQETIKTSKGVLFHFYPYNSDSIRDWGWGCAWRCIQSIINTKFQMSGADIILSFDKMFNFLGSKNVLIDLYCNLDGIKNDDLEYKTLMENEFAPHETESGWADPWIGQMCLYYFEISSQILLINGLPESHRNFKENFKKTKIFSFDEVILFLKDKMSFPIMIDDGVYAMIVLEISENIANDGWELSIADPHINEKVEEKTCFYKVQIDKEGRQISCSVTPQQKKQLYCLSYTAFDFKEKPWICLLTNN